MSASLFRPEAPWVEHCDHDGGGRIIKWKRLWLGHKYRRVWVAVPKLEANLRLNPGHYVGPHGLGGIDGKYEGVDQFLTSGEESVSMITVCMRVIGGRRLVGIFDGRHRFAWMRDHGVLAVPVAAPIGEASEIQKLVGSKARISRVPTSAAWNALN